MFIDDFVIWKINTSEMFFFVGNLLAFNGISYIMPNLLISSDKIG